MKEKIYPVHEPCPCYDKDGNPLGWFNPRHVATALFVFVWSDNFNEWCVLASERGKGAGTFQGMLNATCGYMATGINLAENAVKELEEECGVKADPSKLILCGIEDNPSAYGQHITLRYATILDGDILDFQFSHDKNEVDEDGNLEVGKIGFIPVSHIDCYKKWAFEHDLRAKEIAHQIRWKLRLHRLRYRLARLFGKKK